MFQEWSQTEKNTSGSLDATQERSQMYQEVSHPEKQTLKYKGNLLTPQEESHTGEEASQTWQVTSQESHKGSYYLEKS